MTEETKGESKTWNSKLIATLSGVASVTVLAALGVITGGTAVPILLALVGGYVGYRQLTKK